MKKNCDESQKNLIVEYIKILKNNLSISINIHPPSLVNLLQDERIRYLNLNDNLRANAIINYDKELIAKRKGLDYLLFGIDGDKLNSGALNLGNIGLISYGSVCVFLKFDDNIKKNISFLEDNPFNYINYSSESFNFSLPYGSKALWYTVHKLAIIKHKNDFLCDKKLTEFELSNLVLSSNGNKKNDRFIEAQIYQQITRSSISKIIISLSACRKNRAEGIIGKIEEHSKKLLEHYAKSCQQMISDQLELFLPDVTFEVIK